MSDADRDSTAWRTTPSAYLPTRPAEDGPAAPQSLYLAMRDGCRLAVDVYLPRTGPEKVPTIVILTPYYRRFALAPGAPIGTEACPGVARWRDLFVPRGYALVAVDIRGTGASFGTRDSFRSPREREDAGEIAEWIVAQPWSDGRIGATGISYVGAACDFLASTGHPAVRAIAALSAVWDTYIDHYYPGGLLLNRLAQSYDALMVALDHDRRDRLGEFAYFKDPALAGPAPVDDDPAGKQRDAAVRQHIANFRMPAFIGEFRYHDDALPYDPGFTPASFSPRNYAEGIPAQVAVLSVSGWMDGAGYQNGAIARFLTLPNRKKHLLLGPWDHGARINVSPWRRAEAPEFSLDGELLRFFDEYLKGEDTGLCRESPVHYFAMHAEQWREAAEWPPIEGVRRLHLGSGALLAEASQTGDDRHQADFAFGTGTHTRYERLAAHDTRVYYDDWLPREAQLLCYRSAPLDAAAELAGHAVLSLTVAASEPDAAVHAYLSEEEPDGTIRYVTEGVLRALHRGLAPAPPDYRASWPYHSHDRADAAPLVPGEPVQIVIALLPTAWVFGKGSRIRLAVGGADCDHYGQVPHGRPPLLTVRRGESFIDLPLRPTPL
ncbi:MAG: CocE/NonD family hydrolase [Alphaproteobacteria bacterium]|nr:CocE/NonD family hydrolase [Alphaproteobacteria bacterium]